MNWIMLALAIYGLAFLLKEIDGPWGIVCTARNWLMSNKYVGVFFFKLLSCYYCLGWWCGLCIYLLSQDEWYVNLLICWGLAGAAISLILSKVIERLNAE